MQWQKTPGEICVFRGILWLQTECRKEGKKMCGTDFCKGIGAGVAMGLALGLTLKPKKRRCSAAARLLKLASNAVEQLGSMMGL